MGVVNNLPFASKYGFKSPGFTVDEEGNVVVKSLVQEVTQDSEDLILRDVDFKVQLGDQGNSFIINENTLNPNPVITINRQENYVFELETSREVTVSGETSVVQIPFYLYDADGNALYTSGLTHTDGTTGAAALGKISGKLLFEVPVDAPSTLYYGNLDEDLLVEIVVDNPVGVFGTLSSTSTAEATKLGEGALIVSGGASVAKDLYVGESIYANGLNLNGLGIPNLTSSTNLEIGANYRIVVQIDGAVIGIIDTEGSTVPINNTTIENTVIGATTPSTATFVSASINSLPTETTDVTNKTYVDQTATALAIALGS